MKLHATWIELKFNLIKLSSNLRIELNSNWIKNKWDANWLLKKSKFARDCGVGKKGFENTHIQKDTFHIFLFENGLNLEIFVI